MEVFLAILTYFSHLFLMGVYAVRLTRYLRLPTHLRWELYPVIHEEKEGSYLQERDWWLKPRKTRRLKGFFVLLKDYFTFSDYARTTFFYWLGVFPWHLGFILTMFFELVSFVSAIQMLGGLLISKDSAHLTGKILYYLAVYIGAASFVMGIFGSILIFINRILDKGLREYSIPMNFIVYFLTFVFFTTGFYSWYFTDPDLEEYRLFWVGLLSFEFQHVGTWTAIHIIAYDLFLLFLPYTRWLHYITRFFAFFFIRWDDKPNLPGSRLERKLMRLMESPVAWSAPHIEGGKKWHELAKTRP